MTMYITITVIVLPSQLLNVLFLSGHTKCRELSAKLFFNVQDANMKYHQISL